MIKVNHLTKTYKGNNKPTLDHVSFTLEERGLYFLLGKSGAGKTTLFSLLSLMDEDYQGEIEIDGKNLRELSEKEKAEYRYETISYSFQDYKADEKENVRDTLLKALAITSLTKEEKEERIKKALEEVGLSGKLKSRFSTLSGGEKKRISLARALIQDTPILFADEPLAGLNPRLRKTITALLAKESRRRLVLVITHEVDEIPKEAGILRLKDGKVNKERESSIALSSPLKVRYKRRPFQGKNLFYSLLRNFLYKREFLLMSIFSLVVSLFSSSFSYLLSQSVSSSLKDSLGEVMSGNSMVVENKEDGYLKDASLPAGYQTLKNLKARHEEDVLAVRSFYKEDLDSYFDQVTFSLSYEDKSLTLESLSATSLMDFTLKDELSPKEKLYSSTRFPLAEDEVYLALSEDHILSLYYLMYEETIPASNEEILLKISEDLALVNLGLRFQFDRQDWGYHLDHMLTVKGIVESDEDFLVHDNPLFNTRILTGVLQFQEYDSDEEIPEDNPAGLHVHYGLLLSPDHIGKAAIHLLQDGMMDPYTLLPYREDTHYRKENLFTHNRFLVYEDIYPKVSYSRMEAYRKQEGRKVRAIRYSSPIFTYTASGYISGFTKPFFFSRYQDRLNRIQDENGKSEVNLGAFQANAFTLPEDVYKADLFSSAEKKGVNFLTLSDNQDKKIAGRAPENDQEIALSSAFSQKLFPHARDALGSTLSVLILEKTEEDPTGGYRNTFKEGRLTVVGIYENDKDALYQDSFFPLEFAIDHLDLAVTDFRLSEAVLDVDLENYTPEYYRRAMERDGVYKASFPMLPMLREIDQMMNRMLLLFLIFSLVSIVLSGLLLGMSLYLILKKDRRNIGVMLTLGYEKKEIVRYYTDYSYLVSLIGTLLSLLVLFLSEKILERTLNDALFLYHASFFPYLLPFLLSFLLSSLLSLILSFSIRKITPLEAFRDR